MSHLPRKDLVDPLAIETHHVWSRCVQRAWLMGVDPLTGVDYSHRKQWVESLTEYLASVFAVDVGLAITCTTWSARGPTSPPRGRTRR